MFDQTLWHVYMAATGWPERAEVKARCRNRTPVRWGAVKVSEGARIAMILLSGSVSGQRGEINSAGT